MTLRRADAFPLLAVTGLVAKPLLLDESSIRACGASSDDMTTGSVLVSVGVLVADACPDESASFVSVVSDDGLYSASIPLADATHKGQLRVGVSGTLPRSEGGPFRLTVVDGETLCWNVKHVGELRLTDGPEVDNVPENPGH